jgi:hypothetical protein
MKPLYHDVSDRIPGTGVLKPSGTGKPRAKPMSSPQRYPLISALILATWRTSSWLGVDGFIGGYRQRRHDRRLARTPAHAISVVPVAAQAA